jgi:hypothetical protein
MVDEVGHGKDITLYISWFVTLQVTWIFCLGCADVEGNEEADKLAGQASIGGVLRLGRGDILKCKIGQFNRQRMKITKIMCTSRE